MDEHERASRRMRLLRRTHLPRYLAEVATFLGHGIGEDELRLLTDDLLSMTRSRGRPDAEVTIPFEAKKSREFRQWLHNLPSRPVYLWLADTRLCGLPPAIPIVKFKWDFDFDATPDGVLSVSDDSGTQGILMEWEEVHGRKILTIEMWGDRWAQHADDLRMLSVPRHDV